jgi:capsular polysaccharide transport system permease protein
MLVVVIPTLLVALYLTLVAVPRYESRSLFVVKSQEVSGLSGLSSLVQSVTSTTSHENAYIIISWIRSINALNQIDQAIDYQGMVSSERVDPLSRWPHPVFGSKDQESLLNYYNSMIEVTLDTRSGIVELTVTAFSPEDANAIAGILIKAAEHLVNQMNERENEARLSEARGEVARAEQNLLDLRLEEQRQRIETGIVDPMLEAQTGTGTLQALLQALTTKRAEFQALTEGNPSSPLLPQMAREIRALEDEMERTREDLAGKSGSLVETIAQFERVELSKRFATEALLSARRTLETARLDSSRKSLFLTAVAEPTIPDAPTRFRALKVILTVLTGLFLAYSILWLVFVNVREHSISGSD